ncbi:MAG: hypothetical protein PWP65_1611 [Clostridia bacterium]|nr:hypothetical protein [Clostridia bacterium]
MPDFLLALLRYAFLFLIYFFLFHLLKLIIKDLFSLSYKPYKIPAKGQMSTATPVPKTPARAFLRVRSTRKNIVKEGDVYILGEHTSIGRDRRNDIVLPEDHVSARHALILQQGGTWYIQDLGSTNGTYVNGIRIEEAVELRPGDIIKIGGVTLEMRWKDAG